jgi:hypothetical protein
MRGSTNDSGKNDPTRAGGDGFGLRANKTKSARKWIERFEDWLADSGFLKKP